MLQREIIAFCSENHTKQTLADRRISFLDLVAYIVTTML